MARLRRRGNALPMLLVVGAGMGASAIALVSLASIQGIGGTLRYESGPSVIRSAATLDGRGVVTKEPDGITLLFVGDIMLDREVANRMARAKDPAYAFQNMPDGWIKGFDFAVGNLEGPVTMERRAPHKTIDFMFQPSVIPMLKSQGFDGFSQANNHAFDQGRAGYDDSVKRLRNAGLLAFGEQVADGDEALSFADIEGKRFAFLGFNTTDNPLDREAAAAVLAKAKSEADTVIVMMHWGPEYRDTPHPNDVATAHFLIDHGADMIIGGHPHWEQGIGMYKNKPIAWSLGNFIFDQDWSAKTREGLALGVSVYENRTELELFPLSIIRSQPAVLTGEARIRRLQGLAAVSDESLRVQIADGKVVVK